jgi:hypothetical protein
MSLSLMIPMVKILHAFQNPVLTEKKYQKIIPTKRTTFYFNSPIQVMIHVLHYNKQFLIDDSDHVNVHIHNVLIQII